VRDIQNWRGDEPLKLYGNAPMCCVSVIKKPKTPELIDIRNLKIGILQFCAIQPFIAFVELFFGIESLEHVGMSHFFAWRGPLLAAMKILSNLQAMSSCAGLATLCEMADLTDNVEEGSLKGKKGFVQSFLWGLGLIPNIFHGLLAYVLSDVTLGNGVKMGPHALTTWTVAAIICIASVYMTKAAYKAFPLDDHTLYPDALHEPLL